MKLTSHKRNDRIDGMMNKPLKSYRRRDYRAEEEMWRQSLKVEMNAKNGKHTMLSEMAIPLKSFLIEVKGLRREIATNWCLCKWCQLFDKENINFNHWKEELASHLSQLNDINIKNGIDKSKHLYKIWVIDYDFDDKDTVLRVIANKFYKENFIDEKQRNVVATTFANNIDNIIEVVAAKVNNTMAYVRKTFEVES